MRTILKILGKVLLVLIALPILYLFISLLLTVIPITEKETEEPKPHSIYLTTNGVHADLVLPKKRIDLAILEVRHN